MEGEKDPEEDDFELGLGPTQGQTSPNLRALNNGGQRISMYNRLPTSASHMRPRSGSMSSENSITSQSTVTGASHLPRAFSPTGHPDESTSTSSGGRSLSRLSDYSNGSQPSSTTGLARPRTVSTNNSTTSSSGPSLQTPMNSRLRSPATPTPTKLTRRSSHIPNTSMGARSPPEPSPTTSNASSTAEQYPTRSLSRISNFSNSSQGGTPSRRPISTLPRPQTPTGPGTGRTTTMGLPASRMSMYSSAPPNRTRAGSGASSTGTPVYVSTPSRAPPTVTTTPPVRTSSVTASSGTNRASRLPPPRAMSPSPGAQRTNASSANVSSPLGKRSETPTAGLRSKIGIPALGRKTGT
ncbi:hypothetical protein BC938DRAFT_477079 [Jimgerdemannia flammicorona]|uniref:Uncharacterized protein n=1 Tax=Jimgerdemannia flammicorona TaxID=994334 RepID=A0A433PC67_9FUNG|nr:hypothetical protein BC938DRAFT_477079 [Jimgerdemannia flammicorona]